MQSKSLIAVVALNFLSLPLFCAEKSPDRNLILKHRSYSCPEKVKTVDEINNQLSLLPIARCAYSYKDPAKSYSPLAERVRQELEEKSNEDKIESIDSDHESDNESEDGYAPDFRDVDSDEESIQFEFDDILKPSKLKEQGDTFTKVDNKIDLIS